MLRRYLLGGPSGALLRATAARARSCRFACASFFSPLRAPAVASWCSRAVLRKMAPRQRAVCKKILANALPAPLWPLWPYRNANNIGKKRPPTRNPSGKKDHPKQKKRKRASFHSVFLSVAHSIKLSFFYRGRRCGRGDAHPHDGADKGTCRDPRHGRRIDDVFLSPLFSSFAQAMATAGRLQRKTPPCVGTRDLVRRGHRAYAVRHPL